MLRVVTTDSAWDHLPVDGRLTHAFHVDRLRRDDLRPARVGDHELFQTSTIDALLAAGYDGDVSVGELLEFGDFGIGTFDALDGELVLVDGECYAVRADGIPKLARHDIKVPFAVVTRFCPTLHFAVEDSADATSVEENLDGTMLPADICAAVRFDGHFGWVRTRAPRRQTKPYPPLVDATRDQAEFTASDVDAVAVGFRFPDYAAGLEVPGWHLHMLSDDRRFGGHVLDFQGFCGDLHADLEQTLHVELPPGVALPDPGDHLAERASISSIEGQAHDQAPGAAADA